MSPEPITPPHAAVRMILARGQTSAKGRNCSMPIQRHINTHNAYASNNICVRTMLMFPRCSDPYPVHYLVRAEGHINWLKEGTMKCFSTLPHTARDELTLPSWPSWLYLQHASESCDYNSIDLTGLQHRRDPPIYPGGFRVEHPVLGQTRGITCSSRSRPDAHTQPLLGSLMREMEASGNKG